MSFETPPVKRMEIAHVLFMDIVGYSQLPMNEQSASVEILKHIVQQTAEFRRATSDNELVVLHTGDGMALAFFSGPEAPVRCSIEIAGVLKRSASVALRMGVHSGPVYRVKDIRGDDNVAGGGINFAQRVMDCGDDGHILLSQATAEVLSQHSEWAKKIRGLGIAEVKHGVKLSLFNLVDDDFGNSAIPTKLKAMNEVDVAPSSFVPSSTSPNSSAHSQASLKICLLYKRNVHPDDDLLHFLESTLAAAGHSVFVDRHLSIGVEWARAIEEQIRSADAVIAILSEASSTSEMLGYEVQIAHEANQLASKPRIIPIRVNFEGTFPDPLGPILAPIQYGMWRGNHENAAVFAQISEALAPDYNQLTIPVDRLEAVGGAVPLDSKFYIIRPTDEEFKASVARKDSIVLVKGARQMGKTSLLARGVHVAREQGSKVVITDFQKLNSDQLASAELFTSPSQS